MKTFEEKWTAWLDGQLNGRELSEFEASLPDKAAADAEKGEASRTSGRRGRTTSSWWSIPRLLWTSAVSLALFLVCTVLVMRNQNPTEESQYLTQILNARVDPVVSPNATVSIFEVKQDRVTVLWTEGLQSLPADYAAK